jgi:hypothetical protein
MGWGGQSLRLIHNASAAAAMPIGRSASFKLATTSQMQKKKVKRVVDNMIDEGTRLIIASLIYDRWKN